VFTASYLIKGLIEGRKDLEKLISECYHRKLQANPQQIKEAINGRLTAHHGFIPQIDAEAYCIC